MIILQRLREMLYALAGYRKTGAMDKTDKKDYNAWEMFVGAYEPQRQFTKEEIVDFDSVYTQAQGRTMYCVAFTWAHVVSTILTNHYGRQTTVEGLWLADMMKKDGVMSDTKGAYIVDGAKTIMRHGVKDTSGNWYTFEAYGKIDRDKIMPTLEKQYPIATGSIIGSPMCDTGWFLRIVSYLEAVFGHAFALIGKDPTPRAYGKNSWKHWGPKGHGRFYIHQQDFRRLMTPYTIWNPKLVEKKEE